MRALRLFGVAVCVAVCGAVSSAAAADKSGVRPNVIDVPKGPGSISGLGEQFAPDLNTGSATYSVPLEAPPGTAGLTPRLALVYDSGLGNGPVGIGWTLDVGSIQRQTDRGVPRYGVGDRFLYNGQELVPLGNGVYRLKVEGAFLRFRYAAGDHWEVDAPDGTLYRFGLSPSARSAGAQGTFRWALEQVVDAWGNRVLYAYAPHQGQLYLSEVRYNARPGAADNAITLEYEARPDPLTDYRAGFGVTTARRLKRVRMLVLGQQVRRYELTYAPADALSALSRLASVTLYGADDATALPTLSFGYTPFQPDARALSELGGAPAFSLNDPDTTLTDFDGDALPDVLQARAGRHLVAYNRGTGFAPAVELPSSPSVALGTNGVELADLDADGIADLVAKLSSTAGDFRYFPNRGAGRWEAPQAFTNSPPFSFEDPTVRLLDFDGDSLVDVMQTTSSQYYYWRNEGTGAWSAPLTGSVIPDQAILFSDSQVKLADMNGDRLVDLVHLRQGALVYWPNQGYGRWGAMVPVPGAPDVGADADRLQLADVNGDGLTDLFLARSTQLELWLQRGDGTLAAAPILTGLPEATASTTLVRAADLNGSGTTDVLWNEVGGTSRWRYLDLSGGVRPGLLRTVDNGLGRRLSLHYTSSGALYQQARAAGTPWATRLPIALPVLAHITTSDGRGWQSVQQLGYSDGYYDGPTRQFRGFALARRTDVGDAEDATSTSLHTFDLGRLDEVRRGSLLSVEVHDADGRVLVRDAYGYEVRVYATGTDGRRVARAERRWHETAHVEGTSTPAVTREEWTYDAYGNVLTHAVWGVVEGANLQAGGDERLTHAEYAHDLDRWLLGRPVRQWVTDAAGTRLSESRMYYDGEPFVGLPLGQLGARGALTRTEAWVEGEQFVPTSRVQRDAFGLVTATLDARGTRSEVEYDSATHRFPVAERTWLDAQRSLVLTATYDPVLGTLRTYTDAAGRTTQFGYTPLLQLASIQRPGDSPDRPSALFEYVYGNPLSHVVARSRTEVGGEALIEKRFWYDGLGRLLATVEVAEAGRTTVAGLKQYGPTGRVVREYEPFFSTGFGLPSGGGASTVHRYDALGRKVRTVLPDGSATESRFRPLVTERWDAEDLAPDSPHSGTPRTEYLNGLGIFRADERLGKEVVTTRYERDALGRVVRAVDAKGLATTFTFDGLGRLRVRLHPDAGRTTFVYDEAGNLLVREDARGARVVAEYDAVGRPRVERLVSASGTEEEVVRYHYDTPSPLFPDDRFASGYLTWVEDGAGEEHYRYDARSRLVESVRKVDGRTYRLLQEHDALDRVTRTTYPSGRVIEHRYGPSGLLTSVPGVITSLEYSASGLVTRRELANGVVSTAQLDAMDRLSALRSQVGSRVLQDLGYRYDRVGNVLDITDGVHAGGATALARHFSYDDLYRLRAAEGAGQAWHFEYDKGGNLLRASGAGDYVYGEGNRLSRVGNAAYVHDAAGQVTRRPGSTLTYDAKGRVRRVELEDGTVVRYRYDYAGARVVRESEGPRGRHRTVYIDRLAEERDGVAYDYVFAGTERVARFIGSPEGQAVSALAAAAPPTFASMGALLWLAAAATLTLATLRRFARPLAALGLACAVLSAGCGAPAPREGVVYYHADHLGGVVVQTDGDGQVVSEMGYAPYGAPLVTGEEPYGFTGKELEPDTGLHDFGARVYDARIGRFLSPDPAIQANPEMGLEDSQAHNPYAYARNDPIGHLDPDGRAANVAGGAVIGAAVEGGAYLLKAAITGEFSWGGLGRSVVQGGLTGALAGATFGGSLLARAAANGGVEMLGGAIERGIDSGGDLSRALDAGELAGDFVSGASGDVTKMARRGINSVVDSSNPVVKQVVAKGKQLASRINLLPRKPAKGGVQAPKGSGRSGAQQRLRQIAEDPNTSSADRGWIQQEINSIERGQRTSIRNPPGKQLAHARGREAAKGYDHVESPSNLQDTDLHRTQHKFDDFGRANKERP